MSASQFPDDGEPKVAVEDGGVVVTGPGGSGFTLSPDAAVRWAERLLDAAEQARAHAEPGRPRAPFPPHELVSPHAG